LFGLSDPVVKDTKDLTVRLNIEEESVVIKIVGGEMECFGKFESKINLQDLVLKLPVVALNW
jgi:hypothetical protein